MTVDVLSYPELLTKITADFVGNTSRLRRGDHGQCLVRQFAEAGHSVVLDDWIERDKAELELDDIYPVVMTSLGNYEGRQVAFPFAGYANVLAYRTDLYEAAGLKPPETMDDLVADAKKLTDPAKNQYGWVANGQKGPAVAQDWMQYNSQLGGSIMGADGKPALNSDANVQSLAALQGAVRRGSTARGRRVRLGRPRGSFRQGLVANMQTWSVGAAGYGDPSQSKVVGKFGIMVAPVAEGMKPTYGVGGWGLAINADIDEAQQEAAWTYIKWVTSPEIQKEIGKLGAGGYLRRSHGHRSRAPGSKFPFLPVSPELRERQRRIPAAHSGISRDPGSAGYRRQRRPRRRADPKAALDEAQEKAMELF